MYKLFQKRYRILILVILVLILGTASYGFAATNTVADAGKAGEGFNTISGYAVTNVQYTLDSNDPTAFASVSFTLDTAATSVYAGLDDGAVEWASCATTNAPTNTNFSCNLSAVNVTVSGAATLHVAAGQ